MEKKKIKCYFTVLQLHLHIINKDTNLPFQIKSSYGEKKDVFDAIMFYIYLLNNLLLLKIQFPLFLQGR